MTDTEDILGFWFGRDGGALNNAPQQFWFKSTPDLDAEIRARFLDVYRAALAEGDDALVTPEDMLARILLFDQLPRNMFRGTAEAFASDARARALTKRAIAAGADQAVPAPHCRVFFYLPLEHSEDLADQDFCQTLCNQMGHEPYTKYARAHRDVIAEFGRFPHRNAALGRVSRPEEIAYLQKPGAGF